MADLQNQVRKAKRVTDSDYLFRRERKWAFWNQRGKVKEKGFCLREAGRVAGLFKVLQRFVLDFFYEVDVDNT
jgi:hypothetical protein